MTYEYLIVERKDAVAIVTVNRPDKLNALNGQTIGELDAVFSDLAGDPAVGGAVLTGAGDKAFVAGADVGALKAEGPVGGRELAARGQGVFRRIEELGKPVVAAVNGFALGGGCELAMACHVRLASENATFGAPEVKLGLMCGYGGTLRLPRLVGKGRALEMLLTGERVDAQEAFRIGLVNRVFPKDQLLPEAEALVRRMLANAPASLRFTIESVNAGLDLPSAQAQEREAALFGLLCSTEDMSEGTRAFLEKRPARFRGR
jgi:enoyl-CoA hydratase